MKKIQQTISLFLLIIFFIGGGVDIVEASSGSTFTISITALPQCSDGGDNDGDTFIDFPDDIDCDSLLDETESIEVIDAGGGGGGGTSGPVTEEDGSILLSGLSFPGSTVVVLKDGTKVDDVETDPDTTFSFSLTSVTPGTYNFSLYAITTDGKQTAPFAFIVSVDADSLTSIEDIVMPPDTSSDKISVRQNDVFTITGAIVPSATTTLYLDGAPFFVVPYESGGSFSHTFSASSLAIGNHSIKAQSVVGGAQSPYGKEMSLSVGTETIYAPVVSSSVGDSNSDGKVDILDLSVLVYWFATPGFPPALDLVPDGVIDILDLSILTYHWTG